MNLVCKLNNYTVVKLYIFSLQTLNRNLQNHLNNMICFYL